ncbi:MAG: indolepyruvate ferredoxin oxidoreductase family protein, partial [Aestuariivirgaceae bacterium]
MPLAKVSLDDKYDVSKTRIFLTGTQAIVRLTLMQRARDKKAGLNTAGYVTGYRGSPVGGLDQQFARAKRHIDAATVKFEPGLNEDLAATALWGSQQAEMRGEGAYDGVFGIWYGKGPGVDRTGDVFRHANSAGTSKHGGVLALMGDDHGAESSTVPHQSEFAFMDAMMPILNPAGVQEILDYGQLGFALSRYSGCWVGLKCVHDNIESTAIVDGSLNRLKINLPKDFKMPPGGLNIRPSDDRFDQERRLHLHKRFAASAFARANNLNEIVLRGGRGPKIGIISSGKSYLDVRQALDELGIDEVQSAKLGLRLLKIGMVWPLDPDIINEFVAGLDLVIVVEEKRSLLESQLREQLCNERKAPMVIGKKDETGDHLFPAFGTLEPNQIAIAIAERVLNKRKSAPIAARLNAIKLAMGNIRNSADLAERIPYFCAGCPHNSSTVLPDGGRGYAGIGCHWMVQYIPERNTEGATHMGGEGANWIGEAPFSKRQHVFQNLGDGTYNHSGLLAIRAAVAAGVNITYKILYNDAVAMTGGQPHEGGLDVPTIAHQVRAEGIERIDIVSDEPEKYTGIAFPSHTGIHHRSQLQAVQAELMEVPGVSALIYDQT